MQKFYDYNPDSPFDVTNEAQTITDGKARLNYTPLKGSVVITGFTESSTKTPAAGQFYIDYQDSAQYRTAEQIVVFNVADNGKNISVSYKGVSTLILAKHFNEIGTFMDSQKQVSVENMVELKKKGVSLSSKAESFSCPEFTDTTYIKVTSITGTSVVLSNVAGLNVGMTCVLADKASQEDVTITAIDSSTNTITVAAIVNTYTNGYLMRTTSTISDGVAKTAGGITKTVFRPNETCNGKFWLVIENHSPNIATANVNNIDTTKTVPTILPYEFEEVAYRRDNVTYFLETNKPFNNQFQPAISQVWTKPFSDVGLGTPSSSRWIPKFYVKYEKNVAVGSNIVCRVNISPYPIMGYHLYPAFYDKGKEIDGFLVDCVFFTFETGKTYSELANAKLTQYNTSNATTFELGSIYHATALRLMYAAAGQWVWGWGDTLVAGVKDGYVWKSVDDQTWVACPGMSNNTTFINYNPDFDLYGAFSTSETAERIVYYSTSKNTFGSSDLSTRISANSNRVYSSVPDGSRDTSAYCLIIKRGR